jgi:hypothetical protein
MGPTQPILSAACASGGRVGRSNSAIEKIAEIVAAKILFFILTSFLMILSHSKNKNLFVLNQLLS